MLKYTFLSILILGAFAFNACDAPTNVEFLGSNTIYFNSFESEDDIKDWQEMRMIQIRNESPAGGGNKSAFVSGGCVHPHSAYEFSAAQSSEVLLKAWGRTDDLGGGVTLLNKTTGERIFNSIDNQEWEKSVSEETLTIHKGDKLQLSMSAGGFVAASMLVTSVEIEAVN